MLKLGNLLPEFLVSLRPIRSEDATAFANWIEEGRRDGVFRQGQKVTASSVLEYQSALSAAGSGYCCLIVESEDIPIGYLDYRSTSSSAEILGLYIEPLYRGKRVGRHLLRWVSAVLREAGHGRVELEFYTDNSAVRCISLAAGFSCQDFASIRKEDGRGVERAFRILSPFTRLSPPDPLYRKLQGYNLYFHHIAIAEVLTEQISKLPGIEIVLGLGSLGHSFADNCSDIDLAVLGRNPGLDDLWKGERWLAELSIDLSIVDLTESPPQSWDESRRQAFMESIILHEKNPERTSSLLQGLSLDCEERTRQIVRVLFRLGWIGFQPRTWYGQKIHDYRWAVPYDLWLRRGCISSAQATIDQAFGWIIQLLFLANWRHVPDEKWRRYLVIGLPWLPENFYDQLCKVEIRYPDEVNFIERADALLSIVEATIAYLESTGDIGDDIYQRYLASEPEY